MEISEIIKNSRKNNGMTQQELADKLFVTRQTISRWETNNSFPSIDMLLELQNVFHFSLDDVIQKENQMTQQMKHDVKLTRKYKKYVVILSSVMMIIIMTLVILGIGRANQITIIDRFNPFLSEKVGYAQLPKYDSENTYVDTAVYDDPFGSVEWLRFKTGYYNDEQLALVKHKGSYVSSIRIITNKDIPPLMKEQASGQYEDYDYDIFGPRNGKNMFWNPFN